jgi:hypothetical protein
VILFKIKNTISDPLDWMTTAFVPHAGVEVCDKIDNVALAELSEHTYEAKCFDGFAYVDLFAHSSSFTDSEATADVSLLPAECKGAAGENVVRYTFVISCNCEDNPEVPPTLVGGPEPNPMACTGPVGSVWGDPHIVPFDGNQWTCNGQGEYILTKATIAERPYDLEIQGRFSKFDNHDWGWSWITGVAIKTDITVQLSIAEDPANASNVFVSGGRTLGLDFYVDGVKKSLLDGGGDHRIAVTVDDYDVDIFYPSLGMNIRVFARPDGGTMNVEDGFNQINIGGHRGSTIPGSFSVFICLPDSPALTDVTGLLGTPNGDQSDDFKDKNGNIVSRPGSEYNQFKYCSANWCNQDESASLFEYADGFGFDYYERCDTDISGTGTWTRRMEETPANITAKAYEICGILDGKDGYDNCLADASQNEYDGWLAVETILRLEDIAVQAAFVPPAWESACWSSDWVSCDDSIDLPTDLLSCRVGCVKGVYKFLYMGPLDEYIVSEGEEWDFAGVGAACGEKTCAAGLECADDGTCAIIDEEAGRRLEQFELVRPDLPETRSIVPLSQGEL